MPNKLEEELKIKIKAHAGFKYGPSIIAPRVRIMYEQFGGKRELLEYLGDCAQVMEDINKKYPDVCPLKTKTVYSVKAVLQAFGCETAIVDQYEKMERLDYLCNYDMAIKGLAHRGPNALKRRLTFDILPELERIGAEETVVAKYKDKLQELDEIGVTCYTHEIVYNYLARHHPELYAEMQSLARSMCHSVFTQQTYYVKRDPGDGPTIWQQVKPLAIQEAMDKAVKDGNVGAIEYLHYLENNL